MKVSVIGTGYVGLVSGVCLAEKGHDVVCVDRDPRKVNLVLEGKSPIYEEGLDDLLLAHAGKRLTATTDVEKAVLESEVSLIAVGTPFDGSAIDVSYIRGAANDIGRALAKKNGFHAVVVKSTVVPGTTDDVVAPIVAETSGKKLGEGFGVAMNPEFLREGSAVGDFMDPDRIVYGAERPADLGNPRRAVCGVSGRRQIRTTARTAEM
ncbi:MAG: UDP-glucose/GDP-mannose dehydrogenase family protein, partial [Myxococcales bacterium]|nr:UDP-glucose/GDP-mannose dehydrogenase family protein [Myxococcales bacterium]